VRNIKAAVRNIEVVMAGLVPAIHASAAAGKTWMRGTARA
jgi:hypothetical protein